MTKVMLLGAFHFAQQDGIDIFSDESQRQLRYVCDCLSRFAPDKVAVELAIREQGRVDEGYDRLLLEDFENIEKMRDLTLGPITMWGTSREKSCKGEDVQIGYRLAKALGHAHILNFRTSDLALKNADRNAKQNAGSRQIPPLSYSRFSSRWNENAAFFKAFSGAKVESYICG